MATCIYYYDTSVSCDNCRKYFCGDAFNCAPILFFKTYFVVALASPSTSSLLFEINSGNLQCGIRDSYDPVTAQ